MKCSCGSDLYVVSSRRGEVTYQGRKSRTQIRKRWYACPDCGNRYVSVETMHSKAVAKRPIPDSYYKHSLDSQEDL